MGRSRSVLRRPTKALALAQARTRTTMAATNTMLRACLRGGGLSQLVAPAAAGPNLYQKMGGETTLGSSFQQKRFASQLETQQKMKSIGNIMKITKAMKMVAAARMKSAQNKVEACRGFVDPSLKLFGDNPMVEGKTVTIPITSDKVCAVV